MAGTRGKKQKITKADLLEADRRAAEQGTGETERVQRIRAYREAPARRRSVDNDILFGLPFGKALLLALAAGIVLYVVSMVAEMVGASDLCGPARYASYVMFAVTFVLLVISRTQARKLTAERRENGE